MDPLHIKLDIPRLMEINIKLLNQNLIVRAHIYLLIHKIMEWAAIKLHNQNLIIRAHINLLIPKIMEWTVIKHLNQNLIVRAHINLLILIIKIIIKLQFKIMHQVDIKILIINHIIPMEVLINKIKLLLIVVIPLMEVKVKCMDPTLILHLKIMGLTKILIRLIA